MLRIIQRWNPTQKFLLALAAAVVLVAGGWFVWWTASPLFIDKQVSESLTGGVLIVQQGNFVNGDDFHKVSGTAKIVEQDGAKALRLEDDFNSINGPDLHVYLVRAGGVKAGFVDLGKLKGNQGGQNYAIPADLNLSEYPSVFVWCQAFGVLFGSAKLG